MNFIKQLFVFFYFFELKLSLYCEPDETFIKLINGNSVEKLELQTEDGYFLTIFRVSKNPDFSGEPVLLLHGILDSSDCWFVN